MTNAPGHFSAAALHEMVARHAGAAPVPERFKIIEDTSDFFKVEFGDVVVLGEQAFWMRGYTKEGRFGLDDEPKYWVRRAIDLADGSAKILKLVFHEQFEAQVGELSFTCFRSPKKEARILDLVAGHPNFMHGRWAEDTAGNVVRILEFIPGRRFDDILGELTKDHEEYFHHHFPGVLAQYIELVEAIKFLHDRGEKHGDIRRDHILFDRDRQVNRWIDFDYNYQHRESMFGLDLQGLGNILIYIVGHGDILVGDLHKNRRKIFDTLWGEDLSLAFKNRVANLQKVFPYIPDSLNRILLYFSRGTEMFYDSADQLLEDLAVARADLSAPTGSGSAT
ncbi:MAG: hypothetical protein KKF85_05735 [Gammaproteobacteria bacterium]|nr:hypothetical protein [Rhodocyclaceae bacterium]MBU3910615.1 hypothetical protein [Gammaproteobacteria bacterium]MBU3988308.1 hypothetical protein [Gammaproteobacteria bacterium]MBU4005096.1 hypothetical protein [Gammaproteobacteria bacterium]MBU4020689.1 hypothetical protein [Gammaproteobacteria bacterium]